MKGWDVSLLEYASNIYWVIGIFIFFTFFLHLFFVLWFPLSLKAWKVVDYLWLTLALLSTLGLVGQAKQYRAENFYTDSETSVVQSLSDVRGWYTNYQKLICSEATLLKEKHLTQTQYSKLCDWLERQINILNLKQKNKEIFPELPPTMTEGLNQYSMIISTLEQKILSRRIEQYNSKRSLHLINIKEKEKTAIQMFILIMSPIMLAFALAIRFTKVTAEYKLLSPQPKRK